MQTQTQTQRQKSYKISDTHYLIIDCKPGHLRPNNVLEMVLREDVNDKDITEEDALLYDDELIMEDFILASTNFGEFKYNVLKEKEQLFEENLPKIADNLRTLYNCGIIRYAEWSPNND